MQVIDWLLEDEAPGVALLARTKLLGESPRSRRNLTLIRRCNEYPPVAAMLSRLDEPIAARQYKKYQGHFWTLIFLAEMQADGREPALRALCERVRSLQHENGGFSPYGNAGLEIVCLTANLLRALVHFGFADSDEVIRGYRRLVERIVPNEGVPCTIIDSYSLLPDCKMTLPQTLRAVAVAPAGVAGVEELRSLLIRKMLEIRVYHYVRPDSARFRRELVPLRPQGMSQGAFTRDYKARHPVAASELRPKQGWLRFGFPHSYNSDLLEAMLALAEAGAHWDPAYDDALDRIEEKRLPNGRWKMETSLNGKMLADIEKRGAPSKWVTLRALRVLQNFGRLDLA